MSRLECKSLWRTRSPNDPLRVHRQWLSDPALIRGPQIMKTLLAILAMVALSAPANALESMWEEGARLRVVRRQCAPKRVHHRSHKPHHVRPKEPVRVVVDPSPPVGVGALCVDRRVDVVSTPRQTIDKAKDDAQTQWRAKTQFLAGGVYMDPSLSEDQKWLCSITDARDSASGKLSEASGALLGHSGELYRCYFSARPCRSDMQTGDEDTDPGDDR